MKSIISHSLYMHKSSRTFVLQHSTLFPLLLITLLLPISVVYGKKSTQLTHSGTVHIGKPMPFFSGWKMTAKQLRATNSQKIFQSQRKGYIITLCAQWCKPCLKGLKRLAHSRELLDRKGLQLILIVADSTNQALKLYQSLDLKWATFIVDEFKSFTLEMSPSPQDKNQINLPRTFVLNTDKIVTKIISYEGDDFIQQLIK